MKVLFVATVMNHLKSFHLPYMEWFQKQGWEVHVAGNNDIDLRHYDTKYILPIERSPFNINNIKAYTKLNKIIKQNNYDLIHCHTPMGGVLARLAARKYRNLGTKVIYTAHGFHFFKGAHLKNWILYYPIEKWLSKHTDVLVTINQEDYELAIKNFKSKKIILIKGVGINLEKFQPQTDSKKPYLRDQYGFDSNDFILIYAGELSYRKHQDLLINVAFRLKDKIPNLKMLLIGSGNFTQRYKKQIKDLAVENHVILLGYREDVNNLMSLADIAVSASRQEGLPVNVMEAMATGLPLVVTDCRGNRDLVTDNQNGYVVEMDDVEKFADSIYKLYSSKELRKKFGESSLSNIKKYSLDMILNEMKFIYLSL